MNCILESLKLLISPYFLYQSGNFLLVHPVYNLIKLLWFHDFSGSFSTFWRMSEMHLEVCRPHWVMRLNLLEMGKKIASEVMIFIFHAKWKQQYQIILQYMLSCVKKTKVLRNSVSWLCRICTALLHIACAFLLSRDFSSIHTWWNTFCNKSNHFCVYLSSLM